MSMFSSTPNGTQSLIRQERHGLTLNGRYQLRYELGRGGMGTVYLAQDTYLEREVAVKMLDGNSLGSAGRGQLLHEARAAARLSHPNVVMVFDMGEEHAVPFVVMEYVPGQTLAAARPQRMEDVIRIGCQLCAALQHAHDKGLAHRDVKPQNVLMTPEGVAKLTDFGLARALDELIIHLLQKSPQERPSSAAEVGHLLGIMSKLNRLSSIFELASKLT